MRPFLFAWLAVLVVLGCQRAETDFDARTDFSHYRTFAWGPSQGAGETDVERDYPQLLDALRRAVVGELQAKGLAPADAAAADLLLVVHLELAPYETDSRGDLSETGADVPARKLGPLVLAPYSVTQVDDDEIDRELQEGTLLLNVADRATGSLVWQGWVREVVDLREMHEVEWMRAPDPAQVRHQRRVVEKAVKRLLEAFPPQTRPVLPPLEDRPLPARVGGGA